MARLNSFQTIERVLPGYKFGNGADGALTISSSATQSLTVKSCSGTSGSTSLTIASSGFTNGDVVLIHQSRGTGVGQWEINKVASGGGTTTLTLSENLTYTFTDSGASQAQVIKIPMYTTVTINSGQTWSAQAWNADTGGIMLFAASVGITGAGNLSNRSGYLGASAVGANTSGKQGEGSGGARDTVSTAANGSGGGGGSYTGGGSSGGGGGGGNASAGGTSTNGTAGTGGTGGSATGSADLITMTFGGGSGGGGGWNGEVGKAGSKGGGIILAFVKDWGLTGTTNLNGVNGLDGFGASGGGAGGSCLIMCETATLGSGLITATGGTKGTRIGDAGIPGDGSVGRISVHSIGAVSGTTSPTYNSTQELGPRSYGFIIG